jgi:lipoprotein-anchoring transpeptidase ErfK/SrfK
MRIYNHKKMSKKFLLSQSLLFLGLNLTISLFNVPSQGIIARSEQQSHLSLNKSLPTHQVQTSQSQSKSLPENPQIIAQEAVNQATNSQNPNLATRLVLRLRERKVYVYQENKIIGSYPVAIGKKGWGTPTGDFKVIQMIRDPAWKHPWNGNVVAPGPNNPIGERWIGFWTDGKNFIGFHGTPAEQLIGQAVSHGCVRMRNKDVKALFEQVAIGTPVIVQP